MIRPVCPRLYSIASSPLHQKDSLDLLIVLNTWEDPSQKYRVGLCTRYRFGIELGEKVAIEVRQGILQPPADPGTPIVMFGLGTGVPPFRALRWKALLHNRPHRREAQRFGPSCVDGKGRHPLSLLRSRNLPQQIQDDNGGGMSESEAESLMEHMIRLDDRFHTECF